jgi:hypothetical protein
MRGVLKLFISCMIISAVSIADARNIKHSFPIADAFESKDLPEKPAGAVKFFFTKEKSPRATKVIQNQTITRKINLRGNSNEKACNLAFMSVLKDFEKRAKEMSANAVVNIVSAYKRAEMSSATHFECHEGSGYMAVALRGDFATTADE